MSIDFLNGFRYYVVLKDDVSLYVRVFFIKVIIWKLFKMNVTLPVIKLKPYVMMAVMNLIVKR